MWKYPTGGEFNILAQKELYVESNPYWVGDIWSVVDWSRVRSPSCFLLFCAGVNLEDGKRNLQSNSSS